VIRYVEEWLPGLEPTPRGEVTCLYTDTPSQDFLIDRVGDLVVCSPCSGHGAKFAPVVGEMVADLVTGAGAVPDRFRIAAQLSGRVGSVSL
jgi:sarcosine oxidase